MPMVWDPTKYSREMTKDEIKQYIENFAKGALYAKKAGIDGVEIHAVHEGYLLDQFTIANFNHRTDEYGGSWKTVCVSLSKLCRRSNRPVVRTILFLCVTVCAVTPKISIAELCPAKTLWNSVVIWKKAV